jgi:DHA2 family multidrug resistance protein
LWHGYLAHAFEQTICDEAPLMRQTHGRDAHATIKADRHQSFSKTMSTLTADPLLLPAVPARKPINPWFIALAVSMATFMEVLDTSIANVSLSHISGNLGAGLDESTWVLTSYLVANAIILPISGWLASVLGRKRFYMSCVALFTASSVLCGLAPSLNWLLFFRVLQGIGGGGLAPSEQSILTDTFAPSQRGMAFAIYGLAVVFAPAIGPTLGGWITDNYSWRWIFFINIPVGIVSLMLSSRLVHDSEEAKQQHREVWKNGLKIDYIGFGLVALGLGCLQVFLDKGQEDDWFGSSFIKLFATLAVFGIATAIVWELCVAKEPIVDLRLLKKPSFLFSNILMFLVGFILNSTTVMLPQFVQQILGYNATNAGMILMGGGFVLMFMMPIVGNLLRVVQPKYLMFVGLSLTSLAMFHLTGFNTEMSFSHLEWARVYQCVGLPLFFVPLNTIAYSNLPPGKSNNASALMNLMRNLGGGIGISFAVTLLERRGQMHSDRLVSHTTMYDPAFRRQLAATMHNFAMHGAGPVQARTQAMVSLFASVQQQATMLSYLDVFKIMAVGCIGVVVLVMFLQKIDRHDKAEPVGH